MTTVEITEAIHIHVNAIDKNLRQRGPKPRGLHDETLVVWGGESGRTPVFESGDNRDHNPYGFIWMAGGVKGRGVRLTDALGDPVRVILP